MRSAGPWLRRARAVPMQPRVHAGTIAYRSLTQPSAPPAALPVSPRAGLDPRGPFRGFCVPELKRLQTTTTHQLLTPKNKKPDPRSGCRRRGRAGSIIASLRACSLVRAVLLCGCAALVASFPSSPAPVFGQGRARAAAHFRRRALPSSGARHPESRPLNMANDEEKALFDDLTGSNTASRPPQRSPPCERPCSTCLAAQRAPS